MRQSKTLRAKIALVGGPAPESFARLWASPRLDRLFPELLVLFHQIIRASVPLMAAALEASRLSGDPVCSRLAPYFAAHIEEERDHDTWLLEDLESCGWPRSSVWSRTPPAAVANFVGAQYYWVRHHHPCALLGYIAVLEGAPPTPAHLAAIQAATKLPERLFRTYRKHAELDPKHQADFDRFLDDLPLDEQQSATLGLSAMNTVDGLDEAVLGLLEGENDE
jgi:hypothetical protein